MARVRDILIVPTDDRFRDLPEWETHPPAGWDGVPADLGDGITIQRLETAEAETVMDASAPAGKDFHPARQFGQLCSFVREVGEEEYEEAPYACDGVGALGDTVALSRLVLDNAYCSEFAARVVEENGDITIIPISSYEERLAYRLREERFWLTVEEAAQLAALRDAYRAVSGALPDRVSRALWHAERSTHTRYLHEAVTQIVTGLEALLKTERHEATRQFTVRAPALAAELGFEPTGVDWAAVYAARSDASHGARVELFAPAGHAAGGAPPLEAVAQVAGAQDVLRTAVRKAIEDTDFRASFADDEAVRGRWPL